MFQAFFSAWLLLFLGDFLSTFCYHIPEHVFGKLHVHVHHSPCKNFRHYAVLSSHPKVLLDGVLGMLPYVFLAFIFWPLSGAGVVLGLLFGQFHVWWRHTTALQWQTPKGLIFVCELLGITTPERHWEHHKNMHKGFGDIFFVFDRPSRIWLRTLKRLRQGRRLLVA